MGIGIGIDSDIRIERLSFIIIRIHNINMNKIK